MNDTTPPLAVRAQRCSADGHACIEVTARTEAGQRLLHVEQCDEHGQQMLERARQIAELHRQENELHDKGTR